MQSEVTLLLSRIDNGDAAAADELLPILYDELRKVAARKLGSENQGHTLQATALVHEAYMRLVGGGNPTHWNSRGHFFAAAAEAMRRILVDHARKKKTRKRGGDLFRSELPDELIADSNDAEKLLAMEKALSRFEVEEPQKAKLVKLRFFAGLTIAQSAMALGVSETTADRHWAYARAWLQKEMKARDY